MPKGWQHGECVIYVSCANDHDADEFSLVTISKVAVRVIKYCVDEQVVKYGGLWGVGTVGTFYVAVGRPDNAPGIGTSSALVSEATTRAVNPLLDAAVSGVMNGNNGASSES